jgi:hypothetical protein
MQFNISKNGPNGWDGADLVIHGVKKRGLFLTRYKLNGVSGPAIGKVTLNGCKPFI